MSEEKLEQLIGFIVDYVNHSARAGEELKSALMRLAGVILNEDPFLGLAWTETFGGKMGKFEYTTLDANKEDTFHRCMNILRQNKATINNQFGEKDWQYRYWLWPERSNTIYRKKK